MFGFGCSCSTALAAQHSTACIPGSFRSRELSHSFCHSLIRSLCFLSPLSLSYFLALCAHFRVLQQGNADPAKCRAIPKQQCTRCPGTECLTRRLVPPEPLPEGDASPSSAFGFEAFSLSATLWLLLSILPPLPPNPPLPPSISPLPVASFAAARDATLPRTSPAFSHLASVVEILVSAAKMQESGAVAGCKATGGCGDDVQAD